MTSDMWPEIDSYLVKSVSQRFSAMNEAFGNNKYGESVNYARSMLESTLKHVYRVISGKNVEDERGRNGYIGLKKMAEVTLELLSTETPQAEHIQSMVDSLTDIITSLGNVRNATSVSHGSADRTEEITATEAKFIVLTATTITDLLLHLLFNKTHSLKENAVGSVITVNNRMEHFGGNGGSYEGYKEISPLGYGATFQVLPNSRVITQVIDNLPEGTSLEKDYEFYIEHMKYYMEDDAQLTKTSGEHAFTYHSVKKDFYYDILVEDTTIYVSWGLSK